MSDAGSGRDRQRSDPDRQGPVEDRQGSDPDGQRSAPDRPRSDPDRPRSDADRHGSGRPWRAPRSWPPARATGIWRVWREDHLGDRDLTRWSSAAGRRLQRAATWLAGRARTWLPARDLPWLVLAVTAVVGGGLAIAMTSASAEVYDSVIDREGIASLDRPVLDEMVSWRSPGLDAVVTDFTDFGGARLMPVIVVVAALVLSWWWRRWTPAVLLLVAAVGSVLMTVAGKDLVGRARPPQSLAVPPFEDSPSFPSGHTLNSWVLLILIGYLVAVRATSRVAMAVALGSSVVVALAMGLSRVYLGHHWLTDVLVGWTLGTAWLAVVITGHRLALTVRRSSAYGRASGATEDVRR